MNKKLFVLFSFVNQIEKYWHEKELKNRSEAIRELVKIALKKELAE